MSGGGNFICRIYYLPQTKFAKVMFLHISVCARGWGRSLASQHTLGTGVLHPRGFAYRGSASRGRESASIGVCIWGAVCIWRGWADPPNVCLQGSFGRLPSRDTCDTMGYVQRASDTHPTGTHFVHKFCSNYCLNTKENRKITLHTMAFLSIKSTKTSFSLECIISIRI